MKYTEGQMKDCDAMMQHMMSMQHGGSMMMTLPAPDAPR